MTDEIKPCPFCGGEAEYDNDTGPRDESFTEFYCCKDCYAKAPSLKAWNRRAPSTALDSVLEEAEKVFQGTMWYPNVMSRLKRIIEKIKAQKEQKQ